MCAREKFAAASHHQASSLTRMKNMADGAWPCRREEDNGGDGHHRRP